MLRITYFGISNFLVEHNGTRILLDPCFEDNPMTGVRAKDVRCDLVLVTHGGKDHLGDAEEILRRNPAARLYAPADVATHLQRRGIEPERTFRMVPGATRQDGDVRMKAVQAVHISFTRSDDLYLTGVPLGFILTLGPTRLYHTGDTCLFSDFRLIGDLYRPDVMCVPIGMFPGAVTEMEPWEAALAASWVHPRLCLPMHWDPVSQKDFPALFREELTVRTGEGGPAVCEIPFDHTAVLDEVCQVTAMEQRTWAGRDAGERT